MKLFCIGCNKTPEELPEYYGPAYELGVTASKYVQMEEGTFNPDTGHFVCTDCYVAAGMPTSPSGWKAP